MVRFSCFDARLHFRKHKKAIRQSSKAKQKTLEDSSPKKASRNSSYLTIRQSGELLQKTLEDSSSKKALKNSSYLTTENKSSLNEEGHIHCNIADNVTENSSTEHDCRSEEMDGKSSTDCDIIVHKNAQMRKSQTFGGRLNWEEKTSGADGSEEEIEGNVSYGGSSHRSRTIVLDRVNNNGFSRTDQVQEPLPSDSVQVDSDSANNIPIFSIGESEQTENEGAGKEDIDASGQGGSGDFTPHTHPIIKSSSLPSLGPLFRCSASFLPRSRSAEDMHTLDSRKEDTMHEVGRGMQYQERVNSMHNNDKNTDENHAEETCENCKYVGSAKDWIMPLSDGENREKDIKGETYFHHLDEVPANDFRRRRTKEWIINLQNCSPSAEYDKPSPCYDQEIPEGRALVEEPSISKLEVNVNPVMEAEKRYISSLNPSATEAHLTNLGLTVIPFVSAFVSLKVLNLSGNAIAFLTASNFSVRIASGALPRGLHILNLSKNNISTIEGLRDLTRLRVLDLSYNRILRIGYGLASCSSIKELYLAGNKISEAEGLHRLLKLNVLDLGFNRISTTKCLGQLAANYNCLQAIILEGNPAQKNVGDEQLKKCVLSLLPRLTYYNMQLVKAGTMKDGLGIGGYQAEAKTIRRLASHGSAALKTTSSFNHDRKSQGLTPPRKSRSKHGRLPPSGMKTAQGHQFTDFNSKLVSLRNDPSFSRSQSAGNLDSL